MRVAWSILGLYLSRGQTGTGGSASLHQGTETLEGDRIAALERQDLTGIGRGRDF
jgi:hypothetical protein